MSFIKVYQVKTHFFPSLILHHLWKSYILVVDIAYHCKLNSHWKFHSLLFLQRCEYSHSCGCFPVIFLSFLKPQIRVRLCDILVISLSFKFKDEGFDLWKHFLVSISAWLRHFIVIIHLDETAFSWSLFQGENNFLIHKQ